jgi:hypothetical protein
MVPVTNTGRCLAVQGEPHPVTGSKVVLTVAHVHDPNPMNCAPENLAATCQRCHLNHDRAHHVAKRKANRRAGRAVADLFARETHDALNDEPFLIACHHDITSPRLAVNISTPVHKQHIAGPECRVAGRVDMGEPECLTSVASATGDELLAIDIGGRKISIAGAVGCHCCVDAAAGIESRLASWAE